MQIVPPATLGSPATLTITSVKRELYAITFYTNNPIADVSSMAG
jgi:hypothetical protein